MLWKPRKLTFLLIPEATAPVKRLKIPRFVLVLIPLLLALGAAAAVWDWRRTEDGYIRASERLERQIAVEREQFRQTTESKDQTIDLLQLEMVSISEEATQIRSELEELRKLEEDIKRLTKIGTPSDRAASAVSPSGKGGPPLSVDDDRLAEAAAATHESLLEVRRRMSDVSVRLTQIKSALEEKEYLEQITPNIWPVTSRLISSGYGVRSDPFTRRPSFHSGLDIAGDYGDPIVATARGTVADTGWNGQYGNYVILNHTRGIRTVYMHLSRVSIRMGEQVAKGQTIGRVGSTGRSTGNHVHYEVQRNGKPVNPRTFLP